MIALIPGFQSCGSGEKETVVLEKRITLLDRKGSEAGYFDPGRETVYKLAKEISREKRSCLVLKPGQAAIFEDVPLHSDAELSFFLGSEGGGRISLTIRIEPRGASQICTRTLEVAGPRWHPFSEKLHHLAGSRVNVVFEAGEGGDLQEFFVATPVILSKGMHLAADQVPPIQMEEVVSDLVEEFEKAEILLSNSERPLEVYPFSFDADLRTEADRKKLCIRAAPDSKFTYTVDVPEDAYLEMALFYFPTGGLGARDPGNVEFSVAVEGEVRHSFRSDFINLEQPGVNFMDRLTHRARLDLAALGGRKVEITLASRYVGEAVTPQPEYAWRELRITRVRKVPRRRSSSSRPNVLILCVDALRADRLGCYGCDRKTSPHLDRFARNSLLFEKALTPCSWTLPATASILTGLYPNTHGVLGQGREYLVDGITTLAEYLAWQGVTTAAFSANDIVCSAINFDQGFELFDEILECAEGVNADLFSWLEERGPFQFFGYVHYMEPHSPYSAPGAFRQHFDPDYVEKRDFSGPLPERWRRGLIEKEFTPDEFQHLVNLYDSEIYYWDLQFQRLLETLESLSLRDKTIVIVTADHGEEFFEHAGLGHGITLYNECLQVPLIIGDPRMKRGLRVPDYAEITALFDTVTEMMALAPAGFTQVKSLFPLDKLPFRSMRLYAATESHLQGMMSRRASLIEPPMKLIVSLLEEGSELYDLSEDPGEKRNLASKKREEAERMKEKVIEWYRSTEEAFPQEFQPITAEFLKRLEALGYGGGSDGK